MPTQEGKLIRNRAKCKLCGDIIESKHRHHFVRCSCGSLFVDGGLEYTRRGYGKLSEWEDLSEYENPE